MNRRQWLAWGCGHCAAATGLGALAGVAHAQDAAWAVPARFTKPDLSTDEGGLWAMVDREETRLRRSPFIMRDGGVRAYLQDLVCRLGGEHCSDVRVYPVRTPWFNASMAPNGMMQVWSGLLLRVENEAQLAAVLGHEMGHYLQRHSIEQMRDIRSRSAFGQILGVALGGVGLLAQLALLAGAASYSRDHERQADQIGLVLMKQAGYDPRQAAVVWRNLREELTAGAGGDPTRRSALFASHPPSIEREQSLEKNAQALLAAAPAGTAALETKEEAYVSMIAPYLFDLFEDELKRGQYDETLVLMDRWLKRYPDRADVLYFRGEARRLRAQGDDIDLALKDIQAATQSKAYPPAAWRSLGYLHMARKQEDPARQAFTQYLAMAPGAPDSGLVQTYLQPPQTNQQTSP